jgi:hypothetical protein
MASERRSEEQEVAQIKFNTKEEKKKGDIVAAQNALLCRVGGMNWRNWMVRKREKAHYVGGATVVPCGSASFGGGWGMAVYALSTFIPNS